MLTPPYTTVQVNTALALSSIQLNRVLSVNIKANYSFSTRKAKVVTNYKQHYRKHLPQMAYLLA
jgi:hypothetical protein